MKKLNVIPFILSLLFLQSCASGPDLSNPEVRAQVAKVRLYEQSELANKAFQLVSTVEAKICTSNALAGGNSSEEGAKSDLKFAASKLGANGLANYLCHSKGLDLAINCNSATVCYADAIIVQQ